MQTILGSGGAIGTDLARSLVQYTDSIRLVSRNPQKVNNTDQLFPADLTDAAQVQKAVEGSEVVDLTVGLPYKTKTWREQWPPLMKNVVDACIQQKAKLVFFDNVYAIGGDNVKHITETSPISPVSKKGLVRAGLDQYITEQVEKGKLDAIIARSPDFFGYEKKTTSVLMSTVYDNLAKGKKPQWLCNADVPHTMGFTPELAAGTARLGNTATAFNQVWNLPVDAAATTGRQWAKLFADKMGGSEKVQVLPGWGIKLLGLFVPILGEFYEMRYQYDREYFFDSSKYNHFFNYTPVDNATAVQLTVDRLKVK